jgi:hypothetical protein
MNDDFLRRLRKISADVPPIWLNPDATDPPIREKLARTLEESIHPETIPDDASVPTLKTEGRSG